MECIFCRIVEKKEPADIIYEDNLCLAFLDKHPQAKGHLQLIPKKHYTWIYEVPEMGKLFATAQDIIHAIIPVLGADHVTLATFGHEVKHAHIWIVPQYTPRAHVQERQNGLYIVGNREKLMLALRQAIEKEARLPKP